MDHEVNDISYNNTIPIHETHTTLLLLYCYLLYLAVVDRAIQLHGGCGVSQDTLLAEAYAALRTLRLADGPDEVHMRTIARWELIKSRL